jgi:hypothetical protein
VTPEEAMAINAAQALKHLSPSSSSVMLSEAKDLRPQCHLNPGEPPISSYQIEMKKWAAAS